MFGKKSSEDIELPESSSVERDSNSVIVLADTTLVNDEGFTSQIRELSTDHEFSFCSECPPDEAIGNAQGLIAWHQSSDTLGKLLDDVISQRSIREDGTPYVVIVSKLSQLTSLGEWLLNRAEEQRLEGIRLVLANEFEQALDQLPDKLCAINGPSVLRMPHSPEVENTGFNYFFSISAQLRSTVRFVAELAENNIERIYLLGGPGSGKTSLAYYYWLKRNKGRFIAINLNAESTGDKAAMKSLLCGHVSGAFPGASAREGAFSFSDGGVTFLDESHGVTGVVMQVLMEALDSGQYLPFGATKKRALECAVIFASNRSWEHLREEIDLDEHARLGATIVPIHDITVRREDLIAGIAITLARFKAKCRTWQAPEGISEDAWKEILNCPWRGNMRTVIRCMETALINHATSAENSSLLGEWDIREGIALWEPADHHSEKLYTSYR